MGQPVAVVEKPSATPGLVRFETNRSLTGMGHERYRPTEPIRAATPAAVLAARMIATGQVDAVHVYANIVTVELRKGYSADGLDAIVRDLYQYWQPGMEPPSFEDLVAPVEEAPLSAAAPEAGAGDAALSEAAKRVPAHLLERSRLARERWKAKQG